MENKKQRLENAARELATERGAINITRVEVCERAGIPDGAFTAIMDESFTEFLGRLDVPIGATVDRKRATPELRRMHVLNKAIELAKTKGYNALTRDDVATGANVSPALISHYFGTIDQLRTVVLKLAIKREIPEIVAQGLVREDPIAVQAPKELKNRAVSYLAEL
jgi:AcrR family transcriptional regulator